jgi:ABC-type antimicrobial peptide transport system permease subunit
MLNTKNLIKMSYMSLKKNMLRSFLATLGIIISSTIIIMSMAISKGTELKLKTQILNLGKNYIEIFFETEASTNKSKLSSKQAITIDDCYSCKKQCNQIDKISPFYHCNRKIHYQQNSTKSDIKASILLIFGEISINGFLLVTSAPDILLP